MGRLVEVGMRLQICGGVYREISSMNWAEQTVTLRDPYNGRKEILPYLKVRQELRKGRIEVIGRV